MNEAKILELAEKAFGEDVLYDMRAQSGDAFIAFARLVAAEEREACAKVCDHIDWAENGATPSDCAQAIRARS